MTISTTRQRLSWHGLTERSAWNSGDVIDVWCDDDLFRGVYCGISHGYDGRIRAEVESIESVEEWRFYDVADPVAIRLVQSSRQLPGPAVLPHEYEPIAETRDCLDESDAQPFTSREKRVIAIAAVCVAMFWVCFFLFVFWR